MQQNGMSYHHHSTIFRVRAPFALRPTSDSTGGGVRTFSNLSTTCTVLAIRVRARTTRASSSASALALFVRNKRKSFSSSSAAISHRQVLVAPTVASSGGSSSSRWKRIARIIRTVRIPLLVISVYSLGYQQVCITAENFQ
jgi:hypothetical protein